MKWYREPLVHFLFLGTALFGLSQWLDNRAGNAAAAPSEIVVSQGRIRSLAETFKRLWNRPPTQAELEGLLRDYIREEVMYREALALGLDRDDTIVRRRLQQKIEFLADDLAAAVEPTEQELSEFLAQHPESFRVDARLTFSQVFLNPERRGTLLETDTASLLNELNAPSAAPDLATLGDSRMLDMHLEEVSQGDVARQFGAEFAAELFTLPLGRWQGPVKSGYGVHLVRVEGRIPGRPLPLAEVRDAVARDWTAAKRHEIKETHYQTLLRRYSVSIEKPPSGDSGTAVMAEVKR